MPYYIRWTRGGLPPAFLRIDPWSPESRTWTASRLSASRLTREQAEAKLPLLRELYTQWVFDDSGSAPLAACPPFEIVED